MLFYSGKATEMVKHKMQGAIDIFVENANNIGFFFSATKTTWSSHVDHLATRCKLSSNASRCISHMSWGADREILLRLYTPCWCYPKCIMDERCTLLARRSCLNNWTCSQRRISLCHRSVPHYSCTKLSLYCEAAMTSLDL